MKKTIALILALLLCLSLFACGKSQEMITDQEKQLAEYILTLINEEDFETPSAVRILEICDYTQNSKYKEENETLYGPDTIVVRLQGTYEDYFFGSFENPYFLIALTTDSNPSYSKPFNGIIHVYDHANIIRYRAEAGDYGLISSYDVDTTNTTEVYRIKFLNEYIAKYWEDRGF